MTPDGSGCSIQIVNATGIEVTIGAPPPGQVEFHQYQMAQWFNGLNVGSVLAPAGATGGPFLAQASRGVGDEDDAANLPVSMSNPMNPGWSLFQWFAGSAPNSAHYMRLAGTPGNALPTDRIAIGIANGLFENTAPGQVNWYQLTNGQNIQLGFPPALSVVIVDLNLLFESAGALALWNAMSSNPSLPPDQAIELYAQVIGFSYPDLTTLAFQLSNVTWNNPPVATNTTSNTISTSQIDVPPGASEQHCVHASGTLDQSLTVSSTATWSATAEVSATIPFPLSPGASFNTTFEYDNGEVSQSNSGTSVNIKDTVTLGPGSWNVTAVAIMADNYTAEFTADLLVEGSVTVPAAQVTQQPLNGAVLLALVNNPARNEGTAITFTQVGPDNVSGSVSGTLSGNMAVLTEFKTTPAT